MEEIKTKKCSKCREIKSIGEFYKNNSRKDGLYAYCKECSRKEHLNFIRNNPDKHKEYKKKFKDENLDWQKKYNNKYYQNHKKKYKELGALWIKKNPEKLKEISLNRASNCTDCYVKGLLKLNGFKKDQITSELIELKRMIIKTKRKIKDESKHN